MCEEYDDIYISSNKNDVKYRFESLGEIIYRDKQDLERLNEILNSTKWKLINKIRFPKAFVQIVRKFVRKG